MLGLWPRKRWPIALDIGAESIKMLQLGQSSGRLFVRAGARWRYPDSPDVEDPARRKELAVQAIQEMMRQGRFRGRRVVSALSSSQLSIKNVRLPHMAAEEVSQAVIWEAKERFSFETGPDQLKFLDAGTVRQGTETRDEIILMAAPADVIAGHLDLLDQARLYPEAIDAEPVALFRSFERFLRRRADEDSVTVIVDVGHSATRVVIARGRRIIFIKRIDIGGRNLTEAVAGQLGLSHAEAKELRLRNMRDPTECTEEAADAEGPADRSDLEWSIHDAIRGLAEDLCREISLCLRYCSVTFRGLRTHQITLTGGEAYDRALVGLLNDQLGMPCKVGQPLKGVDTSGVDLGADRRVTATEWALCAGMAIRGGLLKDPAPEEDHDQCRLSA